MRITFRAAFFPRTAASFFSLMRKPSTSSMELPVRFVLRAAARF